LKKIPFST